MGANYNGNSIQAQYGGLGTKHPFCAIGSHVVDSHKRSHSFETCHAKKGKSDLKLYNLINLYYSCMEGGSNGGQVGDRMEVGWGVGRGSGQGGLDKGLDKGSDKGSDGR